MIPRELEKESEIWANGPLAAAIAHFPERKERFTTVSGLAVDRLYLPDDEIVEGYEAKLGFPGEFPFTRGAHPTMYRSRLWTMREYAGYSTAEESNERYRYLLSQGSTGLSIAFDLPTQIGLDSDHPLCQGEVGKVGVAVNTLADFEALFDGIPLDKVSTSMTINAPAAILLAMYIALAEKQGIDPATLRGTIQNDILKEYIARGTYIFPPRPSLRLDRKHVRVLRQTCPALEHDLDQRLSHPRGRRHGRARAGIHSRQRDLLHRDGPEGGPAHR